MKKDEIKITKGLMCGICLHKTLTKVESRTTIEITCKSGCLNIRHDKRKAK